MKDSVEITNKHARTMHFDIDESELKGLELDEEVTFRVTGKIRSFSAPYEYETSNGKMKKEAYGNLSIKVSKLSLAGDNEFSKLSDGED